MFHLDRSVRQMYTATRVTMLALGLVAAGAAAVQAQNNATINVTAAVQQPIVVTAANPLDFGQVFPGVPKGVALGSASAGRFTVTGQGSAGVSLSFVVPANLTFGVNNLPVTFASSFNGKNDPAGSGIGSFAGATAATLRGTRHLFGFLGGAVTPSGRQTAGRDRGDAP